MHADVPCRVVVWGLQEIRPVAIGRLRWAVYCREWTGLGVAADKPRDHTP